MTLTATFTNFGKRPKGKITPVTKSLKKDVRTRENK